MLHSYPEDAPPRVFDPYEVILELEVIRKLGQKVDAESGAALVAVLHRIVHRPNTDKLKKK